MEEVDLVKTVMNREDEERRLQEKRNWFEMMQGEDGVNLCESCPSSIEIRDDDPIIGDFFQNIENKIDYKRFLDEEYFTKNPGDKRFRRLFLLYQGWEEGDIENTLNALGVTREQADRLVDGYLTPKIKAAEKDSKILRE